MDKLHPQKSIKKTLHQTTSGKTYIVTSVSADTDNTGIKSSILKLAERKAFRELGLEIPLNTRVFDSSS